MKPLDQSKPSKPSKPKFMQTIAAVSQIGRVNLVEQSKPSKPCKPFGSPKTICIGNKVLIQNPFWGKLSAYKISKPYDLSFWSEQS